jgi:hypothetical protein
MVAILIPTRVSLAYIAKLLQWLLFTPAQSAIPSMFMGSWFMRQKPKSGGTTKTHVTQLFYSESPVHTSSKMTNLETLIYVFSAFFHTFGTQ